jgi:long-chain fatty acid transport protein
MNSPARGRRTLLTCLAVLSPLCGVGPANVFGGGFQINEQSARGTAMGGAMAASLDELTAMQMNPAVLAFLQGTNLSFGATVIVPDYRFTGVTPAETTTKMHPQALFPPNIYLSFSPGGKIALGISALIPYALKTEWDPEWVGRRISIKSEVQSIFFTPTLAFSPSNSWSFGVSLNLVSSKLLLSQRVGFEQYAAPEGTATYEGDTRFDYGFQVGMLYRPDDVFSLGLAFKSRVNVDVPNGSATFLDVPATAASSFPNTAASTVLTTPDDIYFGVGIRPLEILAIQATLQYVFWSTFASLPISFTNPVVKSVVLPENWKNSYIARLGVEVLLAGITLRGGMVYDESPIPDAYLRPTVPDANKIGYSAGIGYSVGENLRLDIALMQYRLSGRSVTDSAVEYMPGQFFDGSYSGTSTVFALNVSYNWNR